MSGLSILFLALVCACLSVSACFMVASSISRAQERRDRLTAYGAIAWGVAVVFLCFAAFAALMGVR